MLFDKKDIRRAGVIALILIVCLILPQSIAFADCRITSTSNGSDDIVLCTANPKDNDGIATLDGADTVTIEAGAEVGGYISTENAVAIDTGRGSDTVNNYGTIRVPYDGVHLRDGSNDVLNNYGLIDAGDDGVWCTPYGSTQSCTINNFGTISSINETLDINDQGAKVIVYNEGTIVSAEQEAVHLIGPTGNQITNKGLIKGVRNAIETYGGQTTLVNSGTIHSTGQLALDLDPSADTIYNYGNIRSDVEPAIDLSSGNDTLYNYGLIEAWNDSTTDSVIEGGYGNDLIVNKGDILENKRGFAAIEGGYANDTVIIQGGTIEGMIHGDGDYGTRDGDIDVLVFEFAGSQSEIDAFTASVQSQSTESGSATWRGNTYTWRDFEEIRLNLTNDGSTPPPEPTLFADVPNGYWAKAQIEQFYNAGITTGCAENPLRYCPENAVKRSAMAVFLLRAKYGSSYTPPDRPSSFGDVPESYWAQNWIERLYYEGITTGCSVDPANYCPETTVTRGAMAVFILRAKYGSSYAPPPATGLFADVPTSDWMAPWIEQLYREGITTGCAADPLRYCPTNPVTRAAMAVFLLRAFGL
jgi:hypothetical protein